MKAFSLNVLKGVMDEVAQTVRIEVGGVFNSGFHSRFIVTMTDCASFCALMSRLHLATHSLFFFLLLSFFFSAVGAAPRFGRVSGRQREVAPVVVGDGGRPVGAVYGEQRARTARRKQFVTHNFIHSELVEV
jgi:hypothetical protein